MTDRDFPDDTNTRGPHRGRGTECEDRERDSARDEMLPDDAEDAALLAQAFALTGASPLPAVRAEEGRILDVYRGELEGALDHDPTPADLAILDNVRRARSFTLLLTRKAYGRGITTRQGEVRGTLVELRQWIRLEADLLGRLSFRHGLKGIQGIRDSWGDDGETPQDPAQGTNGPDPGPEPSGGGDRSGRVPGASEAPASTAGPDAFPDDGGKP